MQHSTIQVHKGITAERNAAVLSVLDRLSQRTVKLFSRSSCNMTHHCSVSTKLSKKSHPYDYLQFFRLAEAIYH